MAIVMISTQWRYIAGLDTDSWLDVDQHDFRS